MSSCGADAPAPTLIGDRNNITDCLRGEYADRADMSADLKPVTSGALTLEPRTRFHSREKPVTQEADIYPFMGGGPAADAFNAFMAKGLTLDKWRIDDKELFPLAEDLGDMRLAARRSYTLARFDSRIVSLQVSTRDFTGGYRENLSQRALTWDLAQARLLGLDDLFLKEKDWKGFVAAFTRDELHKQMSERGAPDLEETEITQAIGADNQWLWSSDHATLVFMIDTIGGLPGGEFDVDIPLTVLSPYLKPGAPVR